MNISLILMEDCKMMLCLSRADAERGQYQSTVVQERAPPVEPEERRSTVYNQHQSAPAVDDEEETNSYDSDEASKTACFKY